jgi:hypothetical protein
MLIKKGSRGNEVREIQEFLEITADGIFGPGTERAVKKWQSENGLVDDGIVGPATWNAMGLATTDISEKTYVTETGLQIERFYLDRDEYFTGSNPEYLFIHHTAGWHNPFKTIKNWNNDTRGCVATEFVIGGQSIEGDDDRYDGKVVQALPEGGWGWHLGTGRSYMHQHSVGIELNNFGYIKSGRTYVNTRAHRSQVVTLNSEFKGYNDWHKYSDAQIESLRKLILHIADRDNIDVREGLPNWIKKMGLKAFEYSSDARSGKVKGLLTHTNVNKGKYDVSPQANLIDMLVEL